MSTLCHSWGLDYQQTVQSSKDGVVLLWHLQVNLNWVIFHEHSRFTREQVKGDGGGGGGGISLIPHHHFHPLSRHLDISRAITVKGLPLHILSSRSQTVALFRKFGTPLVSEPGTSLNQCIKVNLWPIAWCNTHSKIVPELVS